MYAIVYECSKAPLKLKPQTLNPKPHASPRPQALNLTSETLKPKPKSYTLSPKRDSV